MVRKPDWETMFHPKAVAVIGASATSGSGSNFIAAYQEQGFKGNIYPVNPNASEVLGLKCYPDIASVPEKVDFVIVSVPARLVTQVLNECADAGVRNLHIFTAGFKETHDEEGAETEKKIREIAEERGLAIIGPNGMGPYVPRSGITGWRRAPKESGTVGVVSQSGTVAQFFSSCGVGAGFRFSKVISFGNGTVLHATDYLEYFKDDPETEIIAMYLEGVDDGRKFFQLAKETTPRKPVIVLNGGLTESGARAVASHTGSLATSESVWDAFYKQTGAIRADSLAELVDITVAFYYMKPMRGRRVALMGSGGGVAVGSADAFAREGLETPTLTEATQRQLREFVPRAGASVRNPLDAGAAMRDPKLLDRTLELLVADPNIDAVLLNFALDFLMAFQQRPGSQHLDKIDSQKLSEFARNNAYGKPLALITDSLGYNGESEKAKMDTQKVFFESGIAVFPTIQRAARALRKFAGYYEFLRQVE